MDNSKRDLLTGAAGGMGYESLRQMVEDGCDYEIIACDLPNEKSYVYCDRYCKHDDGGLSF